MSCGPGGAQRSHTHWRPREAIRASGACRSAPPKTNPAFPEPMKAAGLVGTPEIRITELVESVSH
jgi:hypothetical protein